MSALTPTQLVLGVGLDDDARISNFLVSQANRQLVDTLFAAGMAPQLLFIWSAPGAGLTHLLQALCHHYSELDKPCIYVPLGERDQFAPAILEDVQSLALICIDDIDSIAGDSDWEAALFSLINAVRESDTRLVMAARVAPQQLAIGLPDLLSRLQSAPVFQLQALADDDQLRALQLRAGQRGIELSPAVAEFIVQRSERTMASLVAVLDELDRSSLRQQRRVTIPLVKTTLGW